MTEDSLPPLLDGFTPLFDDFRSRTMPEKGAFLVAVAAVEAGLDVTFGRSQRALGSKQEFYAQDFETPRFMKIVDPKRRGKPVFYDATCPIQTISLKKLLDVNDKLRTKKVFHNAGVLAPFGGSATAKNLNILKAFQREKIGQVILKPLRGSRAKGILTDVSLNVAAQHIRSMPTEVFVVEQQITGPEYRTYVVNGKVVAAIERIPPTVVGDGRSTIEELVRAENAIRSRNPEYASRQLDLAAASFAVAAKGGSLDDIPVLGASVPLTLSTTTSSGTTYRRCESELPDGVAETSLKAVKALKLRVAGIDVRLDPQGRSFVLEANARPGIAAATFPYRREEWDPSLSRAIVGLMFPDARWGGLKVERFEYETLSDIISRGSPALQIPVRDFVEVSE